MRDVVEISTVGTARAGLRVHACDAGDPRWNAFVDRHPLATVFHRLEWQRIIGRAYGHETHYLIAEDAGVVQGVLPLAFIKSRLFGRSLVSVPFGDYGGICADTPAVEAALLDAALEIGRKCGADYVQLRHREAREGVGGVAGEKITMLLPLAADPDVVWRKLPSERRDRVRKARQVGLIGRFGGAESLPAFYRVFAENMRDIGSPVHAIEFFQAMLEELGERARVLLVEQAEEVIGAAVCLYYRDTAYVPWVSSLRRRFVINPNMVLYWTAIEDACKSGYQTLDFGRSSKDSGTFEFKRQWGAGPVDLGWRSFSLNGGTVPTFSGAGMKETLMVECWKRLPVPIATALGPRVRRFIPA